jgi:hypothetical protein
MSTVMRLSSLELRAGSPHGVDRRARAVPSGVDVEPDCAGA